MNNFSKKLAILVGMVSFFSVSAMEDLPLAGNNLPEDVQRQFALSLIGDFLLNQQEPKTLGHDNVVYATDISFDSKHIVTGSFDSTAKIWNKDGKLECVLKGHTGLVNLTAISPNNAYVATGSFDKNNDEIDRTVKIWDMQACKLLHTLGEKEADRHITSITALAISPNNNYIVTGSADRTIKLWDMKTGKLEFSFGGLNHTQNWINSIAISADSTFVVIGSNDGTTIILDAKNFSLKQVQRHILNAKVISMALAGNKLVTASWDGTAKLWDINTDQLLYTFGNRTNKVLSVDISHDGAYVVAGPADGENSAKVWDANTGQLLHTLGGKAGHTSLIKKVVISSDNKYVATASQDNTVKVWDLKSGKLLYTFVGHTKEIESLKISPDVRYVVSGSHDNTAKVWSLLLNLNAPQFSQKGHPLAWMKDDISVFQAHLIARIYAANQEGNAFIMNTVTDFDSLNATDNMYIWLTLPLYVRDYLADHLNIEFEIIGKCDNTLCKKF